MKEIILVSFFCLSVSLSVIADVSSFPHLKMGVGARALGMGGTFVGLSDDATTTYWNPAGLAKISAYKLHFAAMYSKMSYDRVYSFISIYEKFENALGGLGLNWHNFKIDNIEQRDSNGELINLTDNSTNTFTLSYGNNLFDDLKVGMNVKYYYSKLDSYEGRGIGFDIGILYKPFGPFWQFGLMISDINFGIYWNTGAKDNISTTVKLGGLYNIIYERFIVLTDVEADLHTPIKTHFGSEYWLNEYFALRLGLLELKLTTGAGFKISNYIIDYSFLLDNNRLGDIHRFSIIAYF